MSGPLVQALEKRRQEDLAKTQPLTPGTLEWAWAQAQKPFKGYWDRQGLMAREGLAMADQGAQQVRQGDLSGLAGMVLGPANYLSSPINALFPIEEAQTQLPKEVSPFVAGGLELMALAAPGPKTKGLGRGVGALVDDVTDAERAALQSRLQTEATQTGGLPSSVTRDQALANLTEAPEGITAYHGSPHTFDKFDMSKIGTGEGAQAYGHGLYFAENEGVARSYKDTLAKPTLTHTSEGVPLSASLQNMIDDAYQQLQGSTYGVDRRGVSDLVGQKLQRQMDDAAKAGDFEWYNKVSDLRNELQRNADTLPVDPGGSMYQVRLNVKPDELLDWDRPLSEQPEGVRKALTGLGIDTEPRGQWSVKQTASGKYTVYNVWGEASGTFADKAAAEAKAAAGTAKSNEGGAHLAYTRLGGNTAYPGVDQGKATAKLREAGVKGIRYKDQGSRGSEGGTYNYVIFDDKLVDILKRYAIPFTLGAGGAAIVSGQDMPPEVASQLGPQA